MFLDRIGHKLAFIIIGHGAYQTDLITIGIFCPEIFWDLPLIDLDDFVRCMNDAFGRTIVLLQLNHFYIVVIGLELKDILNGCSAEGINTLRIIAHYTNILVHSAE